MDTLNTLPTITNPTPEIKTLLDTIVSQREESHLFQFLNGLNEIYNPQRSHFLLLNPLPSVEIVSAALQQEEAQRELLQSSSLDTESVAMFSKSNVAKNDKVPVCSVCGGKGHKNDRCWYVIGYPKWHSKHGQTPPNPNTRFKSQANTRWNTGNKVRVPKTAATAQVSIGSLFTPQQLAQLAQLMPQLVVQQRGSNTDE